MKFKKPKAKIRTGEEIAGGSVESRHYNQSYIKKCGGLKEKTKRKTPPKTARKTPPKRKK